MVEDRGANPETNAFASRVRASRQGEIPQVLKLMNRHRLKSRSAGRGA